MSTVEKLNYSAGDDVSAPLAAYNDYMADLALPKALHGGTKTMRLAGKTYLPKEDGETKTSYNSRLSRSVLVNYYRRTLEKLVGQAFEEDIEANDIPDEIKGLLNNIDLENTGISMFMQKALYMAINKGVAHIMVEYPTVDGKTREDHKRAGARPYWVLIDPECVIGWRFKDVGGVNTLVQLRVKETVTVDDGLYGVKEVDRIRLYEPGSWKVFEENGTSGTWEVAKDPETGQPMEGVISLDFIPLVTIMLGEKTSDMTAIPPLNGLAELNCQHWQSSSDQRNILHYARLITYFGKQLDVDSNGSIVFGANRLVHTTSPDGDLRVVEHSGAGIEAGRNDLKDLEMAMAIFGLTLLLPKVSGVTATENSIEKGESDSALVTWVKIMGSALQTLLDYSCRWIGIEPKGTLTPYTDFASPFSSTDINILLEGYKANLLPRSLVISELKDRGVIRQEIDMVEIMQQFEEDARSSAVMQVGLGFDQGNNQFGNQQGQGRPAPAQ